MRYDNLPIYRSSMNLCVYVETIVKSFDKYHKYTIGEDMRNYSKELLFMIHRVNASHEKIEKLQKMTNRCEELKMLVNLAKVQQSLCDLFTKEYKKMHIYNFKTSYVYGLNKRFNASNPSNAWNVNFNNGNDNNNDKTNSNYVRCVR